MTKSQVLLLTRNLYESNRRQGFRITVRHPFIIRLYELALTSVDTQSRYFQYLKRLYNFILRRSIYLYRNHRYIAMMMRECEKECKPKETEKPDAVSVTNSSKKAALLIGINYKGKDSELYGCENDIYSSKEVLIKHYGYKNEDIRVLTESEKDPRFRPTRENILNAIHWLVQQSDQGAKSLWFQYSGHGYYFRDKNGDERDGMDECIVTSDSYAIMDDEIRQLLVNRVRADSKLFCLMDCCHSGTILDLQYRFRPSRDSMFTENRHRTRSNVMAISGCRDNQTSADAEFSPGEWAGALTKNFFALLKAYNYAPKLDILLSQLHRNLKSQTFTQVPELTCSRNISPSSVVFSA